MYRLLTIVLLLFSNTLQAIDADALYQKANEAYTRGEYSFAAELYEEILAHQLIAPQLYYNLGNAYYRENKLGLAILNYERARRLKPTDENILFNLALVNGKIVDKVELRPLLFYERWWQNTYRQFSANAWAVLSIITLVISLSTVALYLFASSVARKKLAFYTSLVLISVCLLGFVFARKQHNQQYSRSELIIMPPRVAAKSSPNSGSPDLFLLHEGTKVYLISQLNDWYQVRLSNGNIGWIRSSSAEII